jgi:hypothetical protein
MDESSAQRAAIRNLIFAKSPDFRRNATGASKVEQGSCMVLVKP